MPTQDPLAASSSVPRFEGLPQRFPKAEPTAVDRLRPTTYLEPGVVEARPLGGRAKRAFDLAAGAAMLVAAFPFLAVVAFLVKGHDGGPVLFAHERIGFGGRRFRCLKFRSMVVDSDAVLARHLSEDADAAAEWALLHKLRDDPRVTPVGRFLRTTSLDELPQILNVLRGDMSLVGPRPIVQGEIARYGERYADYGRCRPGITGAWQVGGRSDCSYEGRVALDVDYAAGWSPVVDLVILARTVPAVLARKGSC